MASLTIDRISKTFGEHKALDEMTFTVREGEMYGFVGANGAGKSTTMRIALGVLAADSGEVRFGETPMNDDIRRRIGYMPEERGLYPKMPVLDQLVYLGRLHGMSTASATASATALLERLGLAERAKDTLESLSLGNQQRAQIAAALVHEPVALVLDEPFSGLDPMAVEVVLGVLRDYADRGAPVLFSSHQLDIVERLCDDVVVIGGGRILAQGSREGLRAEHSEHEYELVLDPRGSSASTGLTWLGDAPGIEVRAFPVPGTARFTADTDDAAQHVLTEAVHRSAAGTGAPVRSFTPVTPTLAQIFREVVQ